MAIKYPPKPWRDGQVEALVQGIDFMYNAALKNWVPISPGFSSKKQLQENFGVETVQQLNDKLAETTSKIQTVETRVLENENIVNTVVSRVHSIDSDLSLSGRIWKTQTAPQSPSKNDLWFDPTSSKTFSYIYETSAWVEISYVS